ncbi:MAG: outer membrane protein assembly factor BamB [Planctomycetota bacterium]|jgi:outer membrane protein assembly factor BamB
MRHTHFALLLTFSLCSLAGAQSDDWSRWRGPSGNGGSADLEAPTDWTEEDNVRWRIDLPGAGSSTPVIWGEHLFLTTAVPTDRTPEGADGAEPVDSGRRSPPPTNIYEFWTLAIKRSSGEVAWSSKLTETVPHEGGHATNTQASASPVTDGEHLFVFLGSRGLFCLDMQGKTIWSKDLGRMQTRREFGEGASPALHGDTLVVVWDHEGEDFILALDKSTGKELWRKSRDEPTTWVTPRIVPDGERHLVVVPATNATRAYDLANGEVVWTVDGMTTNCIPTAMYAEGVVFMMSGYRGNTLQAVRVEGAKGDLRKSESVLWEHHKGTSYVPSGALMDGLIYFLRGNNGVLSCVDAGTGEELYAGQRLGELRSVYSSVTVVGDYLYICSREGLTAVVSRGPEFTLVAVNSLDAVFDASPVAAGGDLYLRGTSSLYCIGEDRD